MSTLPRHNTNEPLHTKIFIEAKRCVFIFSMDIYMLFKYVETKKSPCFQKRDKSMRVTLLAHSTVGSPQCNRQMKRKSNQFVKYVRLCHTNCPNEFNEMWECVCDRWAHEVRPKCANGNSDRDSDGPYL